MESRTQGGPNEGTKLDQITLTEIRPNKIRKGPTRDFRPFTFLGLLTSDSDFQGTTLDSFRGP